MIISVSPVERKKHGPRERCLKTPSPLRAAVKTRNMDHITVNYLVQANMVAYSPIVVYLGVQAHDGKVDYETDGPYRTIS